MNRTAVSALLALLGSGMFCVGIGAETLTITSGEVWQSWDYPSGAVEFDNGQLRPFLFRKNINAAAGAVVRAVGSNPSSAAALFDGDFGRGWGPDTEAPLEDWWVEIDLQQVLPVQQVRVHFDADSAPLAFFKLSFSTGERFIDVANVLVEGTLRYTSTETFSFNESHVVTVDMGSSPVRVLRLEATRKVEGSVVAEIEIYALGDNVGFDLINKGGSVEVQAEIVALAGNPAVMFDGDLATAWRVNPLAKGSTGGGETFGDYQIDLGANYRVDSVLLFGDPIAIQPRSRQFYANFLGYQIQFSDGSLAPDGSLKWNVLASVPANQINLFDVRNFEHHFDPVSARHLRLFYPTSVGGAIIGGAIDGLSLRLDGLGFVAEFQIFGAGYPERVLLRSPVIDLGADWNVTSITWLADVAEGAQVLLRSRSGNEVVEEIHYYDNKGKEVTERRYNKLIENFRGPIEIVCNPGAGWSPWSEDYIEPGTAFRSPSPRRYLQLEAELLSDDPDAAAALEEISLHFSRPLASTAVGEIMPQQVQPGTVQRFSYFVHPVFGRQSLGFDRFVLDSSVPMEFHELLIDDVSIPGVEHEATEGGFRLHMRDLVNDAELIEVRFDATVFQRTRFRGTLENTATGEVVRQLVDPGNAVPDTDGDTDVVALPVNDALLVNLSLSTPVFSPNGDGVHDALTISFDALKLNSARPIIATIYDLRGDRIRRLDQRGLAGHYDVSWNGRDGEGRLVPPGLYILRVQIKGDALTRTTTRVLGLTY